MEKIRVIYINQTSGLVDVLSLDDLVAKGEVVAYCGPTGWVHVKDERKPGPSESQPRIESKDEKL